MPIDIHIHAGFHDDGRAEYGHRGGCWVYGGGIAQSFAASGLDVTIADIDHASTRRNDQRLLEEAARFEAEGLKPAGYAAVRGRRPLMRSSGQ